MGAVATDAYEFHTDLNENEETIVAVVNDKVVPDVQNLHRHIRQSANLKDYKGFTKFLERLSTVIDKRRHSVEDLMKFMEKVTCPLQMMAPLLSSNVWKAKTILNISKT